MLKLINEELMSFSTMKVLDVDKENSRAKIRVATSNKLQQQFEEKDDVKPSNTEGNRIVSHNQK